MKKISIWAITPDGMKVGKELFYSLSSSDFFISENIDDGVHSTSTNIADAANLADAANSLNRDIITKQQINSKQRVIIFEKLSERFQEEFKNYDAHIAVFSTGIAVRILAPLINSKLTDPAVVVIDDRAIHAVSLLSGHLGGANELTLKISEITGASPVITTATDIHNLPSIDMIAKKNNLFIENPNMIKKVNMAFLQKKKINIIDPFNLVKPHIPEEFQYRYDSSYDFIIDSSKQDCNKKEMSILCSDKEINKLERFELIEENILILRPASLTAGIGCNRGTAKEELLDLLINTFKEHELSINSILSIATTSVKQDETGLLELGQELKKPIKFYDKSELNSVKNIQNPSEVVEKHLGVKSVCEAAAILASQNGNLIIPKIKRGNATIAAARKIFKSKK